MKTATRLAHAGRRPAAHHGMVNTPVYHASTVLFESLADFDASIVLPAGAAGPAFLVYGNYRAILGWNRSILYAVAVGHLADRFVGGEPLRAKRPVGDERLSRDDVLAMQEALVRLGFDAGTPDGIVGAQTREALKGYQRTQNLPPDGYPTPGLVRQLRQAAGI